MAVCLAAGDPHTVLGVELPGVRVRSHAGRARRIFKESQCGGGGGGNCGCFATNNTEMSLNASAIVACLYKFKFGCSGAGSASVRILPAWALLLLSALARVLGSRSHPPLNQQQRMAGRTG